MKTTISCRSLATSPRFSAASQRPYGLRSSSRRRGQNLVEFALVLLPLLVVLLGILEVAWLGRAQLAAANGAREGARAASLGDTIPNIKARVQQVAGVLGVTDAEITLTFSADSGRTFIPITGDVGTKNSVPAGNLIKVSVNHPHRVLTGFFPFMRDYYDHADVIMRRESS